MFQFKQKPINEKNENPTNWHFTYLIFETLLFPNTHQQISYLQKKNPKPSHGKLKKKSTYIIKQNMIFQIKQINTRNENLRFYNYIFPCFLRKQTGITDRRRRKLCCRESEREREKVPEEREGNPSQGLWRLK